MHSSNVPFLFQKKQQPLLQTINVGEQLLKVGFATREEIPRPLSNDSKYFSYYRILHKAEHFALRKQLGLKYYVKPTKDIIYLLLEKFLAFTIFASKKMIEFPSKMQKLYVS